ncbi:MAG: aldehyde dehydrogenase [Pusillimonas sp.]|nr:aldehyde dehydrogenase [Pusillimonas sp.]MBC41585.1 aldehyde dehydrogenase [Pusillimonas sp.]HCP79440.1 aldehyde dehydrogenase [Pusillimonas sp.]|tara:strand:- start:63251 stop:64702 length:1452 start_codon:yes stop_codon:yes gene_type:complete
MKLAQHYIDGKWTSAVSGAGNIKKGVNPATNEHAYDYCDGTEAEALAAVAAARRAFDETNWRNSPRLRADILFDFAARMEARKAEIADWLVTVNGKLHREAMGEVMGSVSELKYYAGLARTQYGRNLEVEPGAFSILDREAAGVAAIILPWNAPLLLLVRSLAPALAAGCSVVIKPAFQTSIAHNLALECITCDERVPPGIINSIIESGITVSKHLCETLLIDVISFTGSSHVGKLIAESTSPSLKRLSLELGGKAPALVFPDCELNSTITGIIAGGTVLAGQQCTAITRILVHDAIYDAFRARFADALRNVKVGPGNEPSSQMGCLIDIANRDRIAALLEKADKEARVVVKGRVPRGELAKGAFIEPSLIEVDNLDSPFIQDELFGPLLVLERFHNEDEAIHRANATRYSLASSVWTQNLFLARRVASKLNFGNVWCNTHNRLFAEAETGGYGDSGYGKLHGLEGMHDFMRTKHFYFETKPS